MHLGSPSKGRVCDQFAPHSWIDEYELEGKKEFPKESGIKQMPWVLWFPIRDFIESQEKRTPEGRECLSSSPQCIHGFGLLLKITYGAYKNQTHGHVKENLMTTPNYLQSSGILPFHDHLPIHSVVFPFCLFILRNVLIVKIIVDCRKMV